MLPTNFHWRWDAVRLLCLSLLCSFACGCGFVRVPLDTTPTTPTQAGDLTGNWQMTITGTSGNQVFDPAFAGFIFEYTSGTATEPYYTTSVLRFSSPSCYAGAQTIPLSGTVNVATLALSSFGVETQVLQLNATGDSTGTHLQGTFAVQGGCGAGASGTFNGLKYSPLSGSYTGAFQAGPSASFTLQQESLGNGNGYSLVNGSATFTGVSCFAKATLDTNQSTVIGSAVVLTLAATDGGQVFLTGTMDQAASTITITSAAITGDSCAQSLGGTTLAQ